MNALVAEEKPDAIVHFAAESHVDRSILSPAPVIETNFRGTFVLLEAARRAGTGRFVHISTDEVYGSLAAPLEATEEFPLNPSSPYSASKAGSDLLARSYFVTYKLPVLITRASNNYGPYQFPEKLIPLMIANALEGRPLPVYGDGQQVRDWLYVDDHCRGILAVLRQGREGQIYNIGGNRSLPNLEVVRQVLAATGQPESLIQYVTDRPGHDRRYALSSEKLMRGDRLAARWWISNRGWRRPSIGTAPTRAWVANVRSGEYRRITSATTGGARSRVEAVGRDYGAWPTGLAFGVERGDAAAKSRKAVKLSILMPVYNERTVVERCISQVLTAPLPENMERELIIVDDCSTDGTFEILERLVTAFPQIRLYRHERNRGKGAAVRSAIDRATGDFCIVQDADLEYDPTEYPKLLRPLLDGHADAVFGSRYMAGEQTRVLLFWHSMINKGLTLISNMFCNLNLTDMETGYKVFHTDLLKSIPIRSDRFGFEPEIVMKSAKRKLRIYEVPISYHGRTYEEGKKIGWKDGLKALGVVLKYWLIDDLYAANYGRGVLNDLTGTPQYLNWISKKLRPYAGDKVLEVGAGIGNVAGRLIGQTPVVRGRGEGSALPARPAQPFPADPQRCGAADRSRGARRISPVWRTASIRCFV